jgi:type II secretory pathway pseudopilin PulG
MSIEKRANRRRRGIALPEVVAAAAVVGVLASLIFVTGWRTRAQASAARDLSNLRMIAGWTESYAADNQELYWAFSWKRGHQNSQWPDLNNSGSDLQAASDQAVDILRRRAGRLDIPRITAWIPHVLYLHLVVQDYADRGLPDLSLVSAGDVHRMNWARDPAGFDQGVFLPNQPSPSTNAKRWPYSSSFACPTAFWDLSPVGSRLSQASGHSQWFVPGNAELAAQRRAAAAFPSQKVFLHDQGAWHFGRPTYFAHEQARAAVLMADSSAGFRSTADANPGWQPNNPSNPSPTVFGYQPQAWEPPTVSGQPAEVVTGHYRWTRGGIKGIDYGGPEINTGQR